MEVTRDALLLDGWVTVGIKQVGRSREFSARFKKEPTACIKCGSIGKFHKHGTKPATYFDAPGWNGSVKIIALIQRYLCNDCGETFLQPVQGMDTSRRMTLRAIEYLQRRCFTATFKTLAEDMDCDEKTIRNITDDFMNVLDQDFKPEIPEWLGIDETMLAGRQRCMITDVLNRKPIDILANRDKDTVINWLHRFRDRTHVKGLAIDMWAPYRDAARLVFPGLPIVVDKFHVVKMANTGLDHIRLKLAKEVPKPVGKDWKRRKSLLVMRYQNLDEKGRFNLQMWLDNEPQIAEAYWLKERLFDIYEAPSRAEGGRLLDVWRGEVPGWMCLESKKGFTPLLTATKNWRDEILEFFDNRITNGYTEAFNGVVKVANRMGRGYTYRVIRGRALYKNLPDEVDMTPRHYHLESGARAPSRAHYDWPQCMSCLAEYPASQMTVGNLPFPEGQVLNMALLCPECDHRFHAAALSSGE
jgi:transposase